MRTLALCWLLVMMSVVVRTDAAPPPQLPPTTQITLLDGTTMPYPTAMPDGTPLPAPDPKIVAAMVAQIRKQVADNKARVSPVAVAEPAARAMAKLCQTLAAHPDWFDIDGWIDAPWTPPELTKLQVHEQEYKPDNATAEFGGGFYHYGYQIDRDTEHSTPKTTAWKLMFNAEDQPPQSLPAFTVPADDVFSEDQFVTLTVEHCNRRLAEGGDLHSSSNIPSGYACTARVHILLQHHREAELYQLIHDSAAHDPHDWRDVWMAYLLDHRTNPVAAAVSLNAWAGREKSYVAWVIAAEAYHQAGEKAARNATVRRLLAMKPDEPAWSEWNVASELFPLCHRLFEDHEFALCADLCRQGVNFDPTEKEPNDQLTQLRVAAESPDAAHPAPTTEWSVEREMFPGFDWDRLLDQVPRNSHS